MDISFKHNRQILAVMEAGSHEATISPELLSHLADHPAVDIRRDIGGAGFCGQNSLCSGINRCPGGLDVFSRELSDRVKSLSRHRNLYRHVSIQPVIERLRLIGYIPPIEHAD